MGVKIKRKRKGVEALRSSYGRLFVLPWEIGLVLFFLIPLITSIIYSFSKVNIVPGGVETEFVGLQNYNWAVNEHPEYMTLLKNSISSFLIQVPIIIALSLILAIILNQNFRGRMIARAIFFLPVIIATGVIIGYLTKAGMVLGDTSGEAANAYSSIINFDMILGNLGLPKEINDLISGYIGSVFNLLWSCGVQIILFISGLQTIPDQLYEVARVEGCTKWEEFWYITFPMLGQQILLVMIYTMIDLITAKKYVMSAAYNMMSGETIYDKSSAMLWLYFIIAGSVMAIVLLIYNKLCLKRWS